MLSTRFPTRRAVLAALLAAGAAALSACATGRWRAATASPSIPAAGPGGAARALRLGRPGRTRSRAASRTPRGWRSPTCATLRSTSRLPVGRHHAGAPRSPRQAVDEGAKVIVGPLFAKEQRRGRGRRPVGLTVLAFSNNPTVAGGNVFLLGTSFGNTADRLVGFGAASGMRNLVAYPDGLEGAIGRDAVASVVTTRGATIIARRPTPCRAGIEAAGRIGARWEPRARRRCSTTARPAALRSRHGPAHDGSPRTRPRSWASPVGRLGRGVGAAGAPGRIFAVPDPGLVDEFEGRYRTAYGEAPHVAALAFDGIPRSARSSPRGGGSPLSPRRSPSGRASRVRRAFRFRPNGGAAQPRGLAVATVRNNQVVILDPAPAASPAPAPDPEAVPPGLIRPAPEIWEGDATDTALRAALAPAARGGEEARRAARTAALRVLADAQARGHAAIEAAFAQKPFAGREASRSLAWLTDRVVGAAWDAARALCPPVPGEAAPALVAVGGYGRGEMAPHSDVDLLVLLPGPLAPAAKALVEAFLYLLWDLKRKVGHATRSIPEALRLARGDMTIRTSLLEMRHLSGDARLAMPSRPALGRALRPAPGRVRGDQAVRAARAAPRQGSPRYLVEPNVKEGKGGLRDLHTLFWIGKYAEPREVARRPPRAGRLLRRGVPLSTAAEGFLWTIRCHLHPLTARATNQLTFDLQVEVARPLGYAARGRCAAVERFMQDYFPHATASATSPASSSPGSRRARQVEARASDRCLRSVFARSRTHRGPPTASSNDRLDLGRRGGLLARPREPPAALRGGAGSPTPDPPRRPAAGVRQPPRSSTTGCGQRPRGEPASSSSSSSRRQPRAASLRRMNGLGVLAAFIPEFGRSSR